MNDLIEATGVFFWPLLGCLLLAVFVTLERLYALRTAHILPRKIVDGFVSGEIDQMDADDTSAGGRIIRFYRQNKPDPEALKAFAGLEITRLERGMFLLDIVVSAAPLLGLLGTVTGLIKVFSNLNAETGLPDPASFVSGIALALHTTMLGLAIAIPALAASSFLNRRIETMAARIEVGVERLSDLRQKGA